MESAIIENTIHMNRNTEEEDLQGAGHGHEVGNGPEACQENHPTVTGENAGFPLLKRHADSFCPQDASLEAAVCSSILASRGGHEASQEARHDDEEVRTEQAPEAPGQTA